MNKETNLRWGLLSTARINKALIEPLRHSDRNELVAVASRSSQNAEAYAKEWGIPRAHGSYEAFLADPDIDVIYNPLPNSLHTEWTIKAAHAGKHVLCEKPLALSVEDVDAMIEAANSTGVTITEAFMYRHHPQTLKVKELVEEGAIGDLQLIRGSFSFDLDWGADIRLEPDLGGGSIWDVGCYPISYARYIAGGEPEEVFGWQVSSALGVDLIFAGQMRFANGVLAQFDSSFRTPERTHIEITGSEGAITVPIPFTPKVNESVILQRGQDSETLKIAGEMLYLGEVEDLADAVLLGKPPLISLEHSRANVATINALLSSAKLGRPVPV